MKSPAGKRAILLISHGSRLPETKKEIICLRNVLKKVFPAAIFVYAFLEIEKPSIPEGILRCIKRGAGKIIILLNFLNSGRHVDHDIPRIVGEYKKKYPDIKFRISKPLGLHRRIPELFIDLIRAADA